MYARLATVPDHSFFLFGPRATGKTTWLRQHLGDALWFNLLLEDDYLPLLGSARSFRERVEARAPGSWVVVDEVQRLPGLLNEVHDLISRHGDGYRFALSGSSAPLAANAAGALVGFLVCLTASFLAREPKPLPTTAGQIVPILYLTIMGSIGAFSLYAWLVNRWKLTRISFIAVIVPVIALILGVVFRGERVSAAAVAGIALVFTGLGLGIAADHVRR